MSERAENGSYPLLDILRFFAAFLVVGLHLIGSLSAGSDLWHAFLQNPEKIPPHYTHAAQFWFSGFIGVQIFFSISGYIISLSAYNSHNYLDFFKKRVIRIYPGLWACTAISFALLIISYDSSWPENIFRAIKSATLIPIGPYVDDVVWTLVVEMTFYVYVTIFLFIGKRDKLINLAAAIIISSSLYWIITCINPAIGASNLANKIARITLLEHGAFFGVGMLFCSHVFNNKNKCAIIALIIAAAPGIFLQVDASVSFLYKSMHNSGAVRNPTLPLVLWAIAIAILAFSTWASRTGIFKGQYRTVRTIGLMTYPLYLLHHYVGSFVFAKLQESLPTSPYLNVFMAIMASIILSFFVAIYVEPRIKNACKPMIYAIVDFAHQCLTRGHRVIFSSRH